MYRWRSAVGAFTRTLTVSRGARQAPRSVRPGLFLSLLRTTRFGVFWTQSCWCREQRYAGICNACTATDHTELARRPHQPAQQAFGGVRSCQSTMRKLRCVFHREEEVVSGGAHVAHFSTRPRWVQVPEEERVVVTSANLFAELARLFPRRTELHQAPRRQHERSIRPDCVYTPEHQLPRSRSAAASTSVRGVAETFDWQRLFLMRCEEGDAVCEMPVEGCSGKTRSDSSHLMSPSRTSPSMTDEGRAALLWRRIATLTGAPTDKGAVEQYSSESCFCWSRPASYELYYISKKNLERGTYSVASPVAAAAAASTRRRFFDGAAHTASGVDSGSVDLGGPLDPSGKEWELYRVGQLHAIPGLPQPRQTTLTTEQPSKLSLGDGAGVQGYDVAADVEHFDAAARVVLTGSVCSLEDYYHQLCRCPAPSGEGRSEEQLTSVGARLPIKDAKTRTGMGQHPTPPHPSMRGSQQRTAGEDGPAALQRGGTDVKGRQISRFAFPMFFSEAATERGSSPQRIANRWAATEYETPSGGSHDGGSGPIILQEKFQEASPNSLPAALQSWTVVHPPRPHPIPPSRTNARHWSCVPSSAFLRATAAADVTNHTEPATGTDAAAVTEHMIRERGVAVLLVHEQEWIYFSLLLHTNPSLGTAADALTPAVVRPRGRTCRSPRVRATEPANEQLQSCQGSLSSSYCFLHAPCRLCAEEVIDATRVGAGQFRPSHPSAAAVTFPRTWLVHRSADVKLANAVSRLWQSAILPSKGDDDGAGGNSIALSNDAEAAEDEDVPLIECDDDGEDRTTFYRRAARRAKTRHACEAELLTRYLRRASGHCAVDPPSLTSTPPSPRSLLGSSCDAVTVSPFPSSSVLLRNRKWFSNPFVLAEEMKYGAVVRYTRAFLAVPRVRPTPKP